VERSKPYGGKLDAPAYQGIKQFHESLQRYPALQRVLGHLGVSTVATQRYAEFRYDDPRVVAERIRRLNARLPAEYRLMELYVYDGLQLPGDEFLDQQEADRLAVASGRLKPGEELDPDNHPLNVSSHDMRIHLPLYVAASVRTRDVKNDRIREVRAFQAAEPNWRTPDGKTPSQQMLSALDNYWGTAPQDSRGEADIYASLSTAVSYLSFPEPARGMGATDALIADNAEHIVHIARVIDSL